VVLVLLAALIVSNVQSSDKERVIIKDKEQLREEIEQLKDENQKLKIEGKAREEAKTAKATAKPTKPTTTAASVPIPQGKDSIIQAIYKEFWPDDRLVSLVNCESGFNVAAVGFDASHNQYNYGLFQVSQYHGYSHEYLSVPINNIKVARQIYNRQGWGAWPVCSRRAGLL